MIEEITRNLRFSSRTLFKSPGFTFVAVLSLGLGIGANTTIFTLINSLFLNPLPVENTSELVAVFTTDEKNANGFFATAPSSYPNYEDYRDQNEVFSSLAAYTFPNPVSFPRARSPSRYSWSWSPAITS